MLDVHRLRLLRELQRRGTLAAVARALSYSPSAISQQLAQLESEAGVPLLEHVGRGVRLTAQARILVSHTEVILRHLELAEAELAASLTEVTGTLRVASFQSVLLALVPPALSRLTERHPRLRVKISHREADEAFEGLLARDFDVVLGEEYPGLPQPPTGGVETETLADDEIRLAVPATSPYATTSDLADLTGLADAAWVLDHAGTVTGRWARMLCRSAGIEPDVRFEIPDLLAQVHLVETGHAVALLPDLLWTARHTTAHLRSLPRRPHRRLFTGVRTGATDHPAIHAFRDGLRHGLRLARGGSAAAVASGATSD